jgi:hypothetical protein
MRPLRLLCSIAGGVNELSDLIPLGEKGFARDVNSAGEVAGFLNTGTGSTAYFWSAQLGRRAAVKGIGQRRGPRAE